MLKALTLIQPYATAIALGIKKVETRPMRTHHRDLLAIHAGASRDWLGEHFYDDLLLATLPFSAVVAIAEVTGCEATVNVRALISTQEFQWGNYSLGRYAWQLANVVALPEPVKCSGAQGLWNLEPAIERKVMRQL